MGCLHVHDGQQDQSAVGPAETEDGDEDEDEKPLSARAAEVVPTTDKFGYVHHDHVKI